MAKIEDWHREAATEIMREIMCTEGNTTVEELAQLIADHTPASTTPKEVVEKYAAQLRMLKFPGNYETEESVLTRFASEIGVDAGKVWGMAEFRTKVCLRCNKLWQDCGNSNHNDGYDAVVFTHKQLAAALKAAGGGE